MCRAFGSGRGGGAVEDWDGTELRELLSESMAIGGFNSLRVEGYRSGKRSVLALCIYIFIYLFIYFYLFFWGGL